MGKVVYNVTPGSSLKFTYDKATGLWLSDMAEVTIHELKRIENGKYHTVMKAAFPEPIGEEGSKMYCLSEAVLREMVQIIDNAAADSMGFPVTRFLEKHLTEIRKLLEA